MTKGAFRFMSGKATNGSGSQIKTPVATIGIRGTIVEGVVGEEAMLIARRERGVPANTGGDPLTASLIILRGPGRATQGDSHAGIIDVIAGGRAVSLDRPLLAVYVPRPGAAPVGPFVISPAGLMQVQALLYPSVAQRLGWSQPEAAPSGGPVWQPPRDTGRPLPPRAPGALPGDFPGGLDDQDDGPPAGGFGTGIPPLPSLQAPPPRPRPQPRPGSNPPPTNQKPPPPPQGPATAPPPPVDTRPPPPTPSPSPTPSNGPSTSAPAGKPPPPPPPPQQPR
ncbi:MAG: hypothetical protein WDN24_19390 [Sphingomonas sp.]